MPASIGPPDALLFEATPRPELLLRVTGIEPQPNGRDAYLEKTGVSSTQRLSLVEVGGSIVVAFWPAELKLQALHLYARGRAAAMVDAGRSAGWTVEGRPQLAFRNSAPVLRLYLASIQRDGEVDEYTRRWTGGRPPPDRSAFGDGGAACALAVAERMRVRHRA